MDFTHYTDEPVRLAVDLVNTLNIVSGNDDIATVEQLSAFLRDHGFDREVGEGDLEEVHRLRERLRRVFEAPDEKVAAETANDILREVGALPRITLHEDGPPHLHFEPLQSGAAARLGAAAAMGLAVVLCEQGRDRLGLCAASGCQDVYVDLSRNRSRRYCGDLCTTRESVAAYRRRHRQG